MRKLNEYHCDTIDNAVELWKTIKKHLNALHVESLLDIKETSIDFVLSVWVLMPVED